ncbi:SigE family RNA polymerase sigma factor [Nocardioides jensenii]|uniref:SigE family RNA polymerase sigma factor n=1 Tax=Nocardioides jensenii TaxID=1843 RepID=UPI00082D05D3|nr:SigE family RNA polymerase sigma factor [Nocardioides jensenii]
MRNRRGLDRDYTEFVAARSDRLFRHAYLLTTSPHSAEDLLQTALAKAYVAWPRVVRAEDPVAYVHGIITKSFLSERRRRSSHELAMADLPERRVTDEDPARRLALMQALGTLGRLDRAVVVLRYWEDLSVRESADQLGISEAAVKNRSLRALRSLRTLLTEPSLSEAPNGGR